MKELCFLSACVLEVLLFHLLPNMVKWLLMECHQLDVILLLPILEWLFRFKLMIIKIMKIMMV